MKYVAGVISQGDIMKLITFWGQLGYILLSSFDVIVSKQCM